MAEFFDAIQYCSLRFSTSNPWWRGHADKDWNLTASIYHKKKHKYESNLVGRFASKAKVRYQNCPAGTDIIEWLLLMQHYGLPTRLLDWSCSPLIALYFTVVDEQYDNVDGALWSLNPIGLNMQQTNLNLIFGKEDRITQIANIAVTNTSHDKTNKILAFQNQHFDLRQMVQLSEFTIHGTPTPIENLDNWDKFLYKIIVPKEIKYNLKNSLGLLGITRSYLFPDLENLAKELIEMHFAL